MRLYRSGVRGAKKKSTSVIPTPSAFYRDENLYHSLLLLIAGSTQKELASQIRYLKIENEILRSKLPKRVPVTEKERNKLVKFGSKLGKALGELVTIVHPDTLRRWIREAGKRAKRKPAKVGRPKTGRGWWCWPASSRCRYSGAPPVCSRGPRERVTRIHSERPASVAASGGC